MKPALLAALVWAFAPATATERISECGPAPFGLGWEQSPTQIRKGGVRLAEGYQEATTHTYVATGLSGVAKRFETIGLLFWRDRLFRVNASSYHQRDNDGSSSKAEFDELQILLTDKYGSPLKVVRQDPPNAVGHPSLWSVYMEADQGKFVAGWETQGLMILLWIAVQDGVASVGLSYDCKSLANLADLDKYREEKDGL